jgi:ribosomal protein S27E
VVAAWLEREAARVRLVSCSEVLASPAGRIPRFDPRPGDGSERTATKVRLVSCSEVLASPAGRIPRFDPRPGDGSERTATKVLVRPPA